MQNQSTANATQQASRTVRTNVWTLRGELERPQGRRENADPLCAVTRFLNECSDRGRPPTVRPEDIPFGPEDIPFGHKASAQAS